MAHRVRTRGNWPGALLISNLKKGRNHFITIADEEAGRLMLKELRDGPREVQRAARKPERRLSDEAQFVEVYIRAAKRHRKLDPFQIARRGKGWTREQWGRAEASYIPTQARQWYSEDEELF